jgi:hypothetical protein
MKAIYIEVYGDPAEAVKVFDERSYITGSGLLADGGFAQVQVVRLPRTHG